MIVTTTNTVEGASIIRYLDPISKNVVLGSNIFSDFGASITDILGGRASSYENKLGKIYADVIDALKKEATLKRANALVGLSVDIDEISGGGKQMFMITAIATPVIFRDKPVVEDPIHFSISGSLVDNKVRSKRILEKEHDLHYITHNEVDFIIQNAFHEFAPLVAKFIGIDFASYPDLREKQEKVILYFRFVDQDFSKNYLYSLLKDDSLTSDYKTKVLDLVLSLGFIDYTEAIKMVNGIDQWAKIAGVYILRESTEIISEEEYKSLNELCGDKLINYFPETSDYKSEKSLLGNKDVWTCTCGSSVKKNDSKCPKCGRDKRGFILTDISLEKVQKLINDRVEILDTIIKQ